MGTNVTFSMLERMAAANGRSDVEAFAKEQGFTDEQIKAAKNADKEFREGKLGGEMPAPGEIAEFSSYKKVNINGIKGVLSLYAEESKDGNIKLSAEARKQLKEFGVENLVMQDGVLYAQHKDGNQYPITTVENFSPDFAAAEKEKDLAESLSMSKGIIKGTRNMIINGLRTMGIFGACADDIDIEQKGDQRVSITLPKQKDYTDLLNQLIEGQKTGNQYLSNIDNNTSVIVNQLRGEYSAILSDILAVVTTNSFTQEDIKTLLQDMSSLLTKIQNNQVEIQTQSKKDVGKLIELVTNILTSNMSAEQMLEQLMALVKDIKTIGQNIDDKLAQLLEIDKGILDGIRNIDKNGQTSNRLLTAIYNSINKLGSEFKGYFTAMLNAILNNGAKLDDLAGLLKVIDEHVVEGNKQQKEATQKILVALQRLNFTIVGGMDAILKAVLDGNAKLDAILNVLEQIKGLVDTYGKKGTELGNSILRAIGKSNELLTKGFSGIAALINRVIKNQELTQAKIDKLTTMFNNFSTKTTETLEAILEKIGDNSTMLDQIITLLTQLDANNETRNQKVIAAINALGVDMVAGFTAIQTAINKGNKGIEALLDTVIKNQETMITDNKDGFKAVIDAIKGISINVDLTEIKALLTAINKGVKDNGDLLKDIKDSNDVIRLTLEAFKTEVGTKIDGLDAWLELIYNKIPTGGTGGCKVDFEKLMAKLQEILEAIKDHDVKVTVEGGKCTCTCDGKVVHEGVLGNLDDLLG